MVDTLQVEVNCGDCGAPLRVEVPIDANVLELEPSDFPSKENNKIKVPGVKIIEEPKVLSITTEAIVSLLQGKLAIADRNISSNIISTYTARNHKPDRGLNAYSSVQLTMSMNSIQSYGGDNKWYDEFEQTNGKITLVENVSNVIFKRYRYDRDYLISLLKPKNFDKKYDLEKDLGIDEQYLRRLIYLSLPRKVKNEYNGQDVIIVMLDPSKMMKDIIAMQFPGIGISEIIINEVNLIKSGDVEYIVTAKFGKNKGTINPHLTQIYLGEGAVK